MTKSELSRFLKLVKASYQTFSISPETVDAWYIQLHDVDFKECVEALKTYGVDSEKDPPNPGQILKRTKTGHAQKTDIIKRERIMREGVRYLRETTIWADKRKEPTVREYFEGRPEFDIYYARLQNKAGLMKLYSTMPNGLRSYHYVRQCDWPITGYETIQGERFPYSEIPAQE